MEKLVLRFLIKNSRQFLIASAFAASFSLGACSPGAVDDSAVIDSYTITNGSFSQSSSTTISGFGSVRFTNVLNGIFSSNSFALKAQLDNPNDSVTVFLNSNNMVMNSSSGGVAISFTRSGASVVGSIAVNSSSVTMNPSRLSFYVPTALDVIIEVHNISSSKSRVLVWRRDLTVYSAANADVDSENSTDYSGNYPSTGGSGQFYGLNLNGATVTGAALGLPKIAN